MVILRTILIVVALNAAAAAQIETGDFIADFESGNIANIQEVGIDSFTFEIRLDDNHGDTYGWYYFAIAGNRGRTVTLFLTNPDGWQNINCHPLVSFDNLHWGRVNDVWMSDGRLSFRRYLPADTVWFVQDFPYTVTSMYSFLDSLESSPVVGRQTLGYSVHNRPVDMITITDNEYPAARKKTVWLISRQHPMETPPTFLIHSLINLILNDSEFSRRFLRDIDLRIVPIVNVDGAAEGYSRHNVNGRNLNRVWNQNLDLEEPEVRAVHRAIDDYLSDGGDIDLFIDLHAAPDYYDFGYRMARDFSGAPYYYNQETFMHLIETYDPWHDHTRWRDLDTSYASGVSCNVLYNMYGLDVLTIENPWTKRNTGAFITVQTLIDQGPPAALAIYDYLFPLNVYDENDNLIDTLAIFENILPKVSDYNRRVNSSLQISASCSTSGDSETVTLYRENFDGLFLPLLPLETNDSEAVPGDGVISVAAGQEIILSYIEPDLPDRIYRRFLHAVEPTGIRGPDITLPEIDLAAYPNPFNSTCVIDINSGADEIRVFDISGALVNRLSAVDGRAYWDGRSAEGKSLGSGVYFLQAAINGQEKSVKIILLK